MILDDPKFREACEAVALEEYRETFWIDSGYAESCCESPIEVKLVLAFLAKYPRYFHVYTLIPQWACGPYRADFYLESDMGKALIVECDGHEFHERTKEQAAHDRKRDRWFLEHGHTVVRFTGSEIYRDPFGCAEQLFALLEKQPSRYQQARAVGHDGSARDDGGTVGLDHTATPVLKA